MKIEQLIFVPKINDIRKFRPHLLKLLPLPKSWGLCNQPGLCVCASLDGITEAGISWLHWNLVLSFGLAVGRIK